jgi:hypothetical protein
MDRRVFQPEPTNSKTHRRNALRMAAAMLLAGLLALGYLHGDVLGLVGGRQGASLIGLALLTVLYLSLRLKLKRTQRPASSVETTPTVTRRRRVHFPAAPPE